MTCVGKSEGMIPLLTTVFGIALLLGLGTWQVVRLQGKETLIKTVEEQLALPPVEVSALSDLEVHSSYHRVRVQGEFDHQKELYFYNRRGKDQGYDVVVPFTLKDGTQIYVNRGFVPMEKRDPATRVSPLSKGTLGIEAVIVPKEERALFAPDNNAGKNVWFSTDFDAMNKVLNIDAKPIMLRVTGKFQSNVYPIPAEMHPKIYNNHLAYAITWYSLAIVLLVIYIIYKRKPEPRRPGAKL